MLNAVTASSKGNKGSELSLGPHSLREGLRAAASTLTETTLSSSTFSPLLDVSFLL